MGGTGAGAGGGCGRSTPITKISAVGSCLPESCGHHAPSREPAATKDARRRPLRWECRRGDSGRVKAVAVKRAGLGFIRRRTFPGRGLRITAIIPASPP